MSIYNGKHVKITITRSHGTRSYTGLAVSSAYNPENTSDGGCFESWAFLLRGEDGKVEIIHMLDGDSIEDLDAQKVVEAALELGKAIEGSPFFESEGEE